MEREKLEKETEKSQVRDVTVKWQRKVTKFEIIDENLVPRDLCTPDEKKIRERVKNWSLEIPWVRVREETAIY
jgi:hypothetical protein